MDTGVFRSMTYGLYVLGIHLDGRDIGCTVNSVFQVTSNPPVIAVSVNHSNYTNECLKYAGCFSVNILSESAPMELIGVFGFASSREMDKFADFPHKRSGCGAPVITQGSCGWLTCDIIGTSELSTHTVFFAEVKDSENFGTGVPMTYAYYHKVKNGETPKAAPSYIDEKPPEDK